MFKLIKLVLFIKKSPLFYCLALAVRGKFRFKMFPFPPAELCILGYPRSGNTFAINIVKRIAPELRFSSHIHTVAAIKIALCFNVPTIILIRAPEEAIASYVLRRSSTPRNFSMNEIERSLAEYLSYYRYVASKLGYLNVLDAAKFFRNPYLLANTVKKVVSEPYKVNAEKNYLEQIVKDIIQRLKNDKRPASKNRWSSPEKEVLKTKVRYKLLQLNNFAEASHLYSKLSSL